MTTMTMQKKSAVLMLAIAMAATCLGGCKDKKKGGGVGGGDETAAVANLPTEEDFEDAAESKITPENLDQEIAKLEDELKDTKPAK